MSETKSLVSCIKDGLYEQLLSSIQGHEENKVLATFIGYSPGEAEKKLERYVQRTEKEPEIVFLINLGG